MNLNDLNLITNSKWINVKFDDLSNALCKRIDERFQTAIKRIQDVDNVTRNTSKSKINDSDGNICINGCLLYTSRCV